MNKNQNEKDRKQCNKKTPNKYLESKTDVLDNVIPIQRNLKQLNIFIEAYEQLGANDSLGFDFEALVNASSSVGGQFQFKNEKTWSSTSESSKYSKYFDVCNERLNLLIQTIPFYERNQIEISEFTNGEIMSMKHNSNKYSNLLEHDGKYCTNQYEAMKIPEKQLHVLAEASEANAERSSNEPEQAKEICQSSSKEGEGNAAVLGTEAGNLEQWLDDFLEE